MYSSIKGKKKQSIIVYKDRLIKRIKEMFEKSNMKIAEERILVIFFPVISSFKMNAPCDKMNEMLFHNTKKLINNNSDNIVTTIEDNHNIKQKINGDKINNNDLPSANSCINHLFPASRLKLVNKSPKRSYKYKVMQFDADDF